MSNSSIWHIDMTLSGIITLGPSDTDRVLYIPQNSTERNLAIRLFKVITRELAWGVISHCWLSVYSIARIDWAAYGIREMINWRLKWKAQMTFTFCRQLKRMETCLNLTDKKVKQEFPGQMMVKSMPDCESKNARTIEAGIWKKEWWKGSLKEICLFLLKSCMYIWRTHNSTIIPSLDLLVN